jgi:hypothetical protein
VSPVLRVPLLDDYLRFVASRCRPNTVLEAAFDLKVFFTVVGKEPDDVRPADVLAFVTAQRSGRPSIEGVVQPVNDNGEAGVSLRTVRRRLSTVSGLYVFLHTRGDVAANPVPRGLPTRRKRRRPHQGVPLVRRVRSLPRILAPVGRCPDRGAAHSSGSGDGARRAAPLRDARAAAGESAGGGGAAGVHRRGQGRAAAADTGLAPLGIDRRSTRRCGPSKSPQQKIQPRGCRPSLERIARTVRDTPQ